MEAPRNRTRQAAFLCIFVVTPLLHADPQPNQFGPSALKGMTLEQLSQIEVTTPSKEPQKANRTPMAIYVITGDEIRRSGATCIPEALRLAPGVEVARIDANKWSIGIRGFGSRLSRSVLVLIDGRTVYTTLFDGTYWEVQDTNMDDIDRIEVIRGPGGTIWGPNAVNGIINVLTKNSKDTQGILASAGGGNEEQGFANLRYGGSDGDDLTYRFYIKGFTRGPEDHPDHENFDDWRAAQGGFRMDWTPNHRDSFTLQGDAYAEEAGERVSAVSYTPPYSQNIDGNADLSGVNLLARWKRTVNENNDFQLQVYYDRTNRFEPNFAEIRNTGDVDFLQRIRAPWHQQISWGLGARFSAGDEIEVVSGLTFSPAQRTDYLLSGFLQDEIALIPDRLSLTLGTKLLKTNFTGVQPQPSARLLWTPTDRSAVWAAVTHAVRTPSDAEEDFYLSGYIGTAPNGLPYFARFNANPHFAPEQLNGYELGYRRMVKKSIYVDIATFFNHYHDLFDEEIIGTPYLETDPGPPHLLLPAQFGNGILGNTTGFEIAPEWQPTSNWRIRASYSYLNIDLKNGPKSLDIGTIHGIEGASPKHEAVILSALDLTKKLQLDLTYRYVSTLWAQGIPSYSTGDARFAWRLNHQLELALVGRNLLQPSHVEYNADPLTVVGIKRSGYIELTWMMK